MKKRVLALLSVLCLGVGCLGACGNSTGTDVAPTAEPTATTAPTATPEPTATTAPTATPEPTATTAPTATPKPTATPTPEASGPAD